MDPAVSWAATLTEHMEIVCAQEPVELLRCNYRLRDGGNLSSSVAEFAGHVVAGKDVSPYPEPGDTTAVMILVDTSDPARQPAIERVIAHIDILLAKAKSHHRFGLATFDTDLYLLADVGTSRADLQSAAATLQAKGATTELYRNVREAVRLLGRVSGTRKALVIMSDGLAEDYAYHHEDVVRLARDLNVIIHSIGYPRSVAQSVALQTVRRLSDETGGIYVQANHVDYSIPDGVLARTLNATDSGGAVEFDLNRLIMAGVGGAVDLSLGFQNADQSFIVLAPVRLPGDNSQVPAESGANTPTDGTTTTLTVEAPAAFAPAPRRPAAIVPEQPVWPWFAALILLMLIILAVILVAFRRVRRSLAEAPKRPDNAAKPLAYLVMNDDRETRHVIDKTPWRIGRGRNNDLTIADHSVSRLHAEVRSNEEGQLLLSDLESLNGVFVNDNRIDSIQLREGDSVDIGDVGMHFTLHDESYATEDPTVLVRTRTPM